MSGTIIFISTILLFMSSCFEQDTKSSAGSKSISQSELGYRGNVERSIELKFILKKSNITKITAIAKVPMNYKGTLKYKWTLGSGLTIQSGELTGTIDKIAENKPLVLQIQINGFDEKNIKHVRFEIMGTDSDRPVFADGIVSSDQQNSFEQVVKEIENYKIENQK